jgi:hypothetical protein
LGSLRIGGLSGGHGNGLEGGDRDHAAVELDFHFCSISVAPAGCSMLDARAQGARLRSCQVLVEKVSSLTPMAV